MQWSEQSLELRGAAGITNFVKPEKTGFCQINFTFQTQWDTVGFAVNFNKFLWSFYKYIDLLFWRMSKDLFFIYNFCNIYYLAKMKQDTKDLMVLDKRYYNILHIIKDSSM